MAKLCLKKKSKRMPLRKKYKILKKVREHNRKVRREARKNPKKVKKNTIAQIPNLCPFKEDLLKEMIAQKQQKEEEIKARRQAEKLEREKKKQAAQQLNLTALVEDAEKKQQIHQETNDESVDGTENKAIDKKESMQKFYREFKKVVAESNVILQVLDARDPIGTRSKHVEDCVLQSAEKRLVLLLNKADLIPRENLKNWLKYFQQFFPTVPFKASTQQQKKHLSQRKKLKNLPKEALESSNCVGADLLMSLLGNYCRNKDVKQSITVGVVGMPNVGKSSIINSLKRCRSCHVGATPGITKRMQEVHLDSKIKLIDCPGVVYNERNGGENARNALKNTARSENLIDPIGAATAILLRINKQQMIEQYKLRTYSSVDEFFCIFAKRLGFMRKGGVPDVNRAAKVLIDDWNRGRIKHYTEPPELSKEVHVDAQIVQTMTKEFDISSFETMETYVIESLQPPNERFTKANKQSKDNANAMDVETADVQKAVEMGAAVEDANLIAESVKIEKSKRKRRKKKKQVGEKPDKELSLEGNQKFNNQRKLQFKKLKKEKARRVRDASNLANTLSAISLDGSQKEDYDFSTLG